MMDELTSLMQEIKILNEMKDQNLIEVTNIIAKIFEKLSEIGIEIVNDNEYDLDTISYEKGKITLFFE